MLKPPNRQVIEFLMDALAARYGQGNDPEVLDDITALARKLGDLDRPTSR